MTIKWDHENFQKLLDRVNLARRNQAVVYGQTCQDLTRGDFEIATCIVLAHYESQMIERTKNLESSIRQTSLHLTQSMAKEKALGYRVEELERLIHQLDKEKEALEFRIQQRDKLLADLKRPESVPA